MRTFVALVLFLTLLFAADGDIDEEEEKLPTKCHVCKHLVQELEDELERSSKSNEIFRTGQIFQEQRKEINYRKSEVRLNEALENACSNVLDYKVHKDKIKALRYEKKESVTFDTLKGLKNRGVKVELGFPYEMWDSPDAEVTRLKSRCELMVETFEDDLTEWYWHHQKENLTNWLCIERVLDPGEEECFDETEPEKKDDDKDGSENEESKERKTEETEKKETGKKGNSKEKKTQGKKKDKKKDAKKSSTKQGKPSASKEDDSEKIQRLIREQAEEQKESRRNRKKEFVGGKLDEQKRRELQMRLRDIHDVDRLRRELRKIRQREMTEDDYTPKESWERHMDSSIPEEVRRDMRRHRYERMQEPEDLRRELRMRVIDLDEEDDFMRENPFAFRELHHRYMMEAEEIRDPSELKKRIDDLDALSAIFSGGYDRGHRRGRHGRRHHRDEL